MGGAEVREGEEREQIVDERTDTGRREAARALVWLYVKTFGEALSKTKYSSRWLARSLTAIIPLRGS